MNVYDVGECGDILSKFSYVVVEWACSEPVHGQIHRVLNAIWCKCDAIQSQSDATLLRNLNLIYKQIGPIFEFLNLWKSYLLEIKLKTSNASELLETEELERTEHNMTPDQQESRLGDIAQAPDGHLDYIGKVPEGGEIVKITYFLPSGAYSMLRCYTLRAAKTISAGAMR